VADKLRACDVLNWEQLCAMSQYIDPALAQERTTDIFAVLAYTITSTGDEDKRDQILTSILLNSTYGSRPESNEAFLKLVADRTKSELEPLREFAKQCGVKLKRKPLW
jgi:hypothetical protein